MTLKQLLKNFFKWMLFSALLNLSKNKYFYVRWKAVIANTITLEVYLVIGKFIKIQWSKKSLFVIGLTVVKNGRKHVSCDSICGTIIQSKASISVIGKVVKGKKDSFLNLSWLDICWRIREFPNPNWFKLRKSQKYIFVNGQIVISSILQNIH